jgi:choline dehydrogenase-like flavoprotein
VSERFDVVVVGSGAGGGVIAGELAERGRSVLLLEAGPHRTAADFTRWEAKANYDIWWPLRFAPINGGADGMVVMIGGRCVGGTTTINTKVALRAHQLDFDKWHAAAGMLNDSGQPFGPADLAPHYDRVSQALGVRERADWTHTVHTLQKGFRACGAELEPVFSYTDENCMKCGSCLQGCPTNAGKSTLNTYIHRAWARGKLELRAESPVERVLIEDRGSGLEATGVEYSDASGERHTVEAGAVVVAGGTLNTPQILIRSGIRELTGGSPSSRLVGRNLGLHPMRLVYGLFDEPQDAHKVYPISSHCMKFQRDEDGGFVLEAATVQDPIGFTVSLTDENGPMWGEPLVEAARRYRYWTGVLLMTNDENNGRVDVAEDGTEVFAADFVPSEFERLDNALDFSKQVLEAAGAKQVVWTGISSTHVQGSCRMGSDPARSVVDEHGESHDVKRLFVGDASVIPRTLSVNPSLTIMALASRLAEHLEADPHGYLEPAAQTAARV